METGWTCTLGDASNPSSCIDICGDGKVMPSNPAATYCDDGNIVSGDGCSSTCSEESKWSCSRGTPAIPSTCIDICGDGFVVKTASGY